MSAQAPSGGAGPGQAAARPVSLPNHLTVRELSDLLGVTPRDVIKGLMKRGVMAAINQTVEYEMAASVALDMGFEAQPLEQPAAVSEKGGEGSLAGELPPP